jgi:hypothetical protein
LQDALFNEGDLDGLLRAYEQRLSHEIADLDGQRILATSFSDLQAYFEDRYRVDVPKLGQPEALPPVDTKLMLSPHESAFMYDSPTPVQLPATTFSLRVPFEGDPDLFKLAPNPRYLTLIEGSVECSTLVLRHTCREHDGNAISSAFKRTLGTIDEYLQTQRRQVAEWNAKLSERIKALLEQRKQKALSAQNVAESLGFPLVRRDGPVYQVPVTRKRITQMPAPGPVPFKPEPRLELKQYDEILGTISSLAIAMERSPSAFASLGEEQLRDHLLAILNTQFEGKATGETFNKAGKTDILIRENDRSIFIAECKIWDGPKTLTQALDQILSYASWRDSKLAVILFNRRKDFSSVLGAISETTRSHPQFKRQLEYPVEGAYRFAFGQKGDASRDLTITVVAFDVPTPEQATQPSVDMPLPATPAVEPPRPRAVRARAGRIASPRPAEPAPRRPRRRG